MRCATRWLLVVLAFAVVAGLAVSAEDATYIGAAKCKMCHKLQFTSWEETAHAKAFDVLKDDEKSKAECLGCHATGKSAEMPGVQCEACHGAGSGYKAMKVMKDRDAALAAGLVMPDEATCRGCHEGAPHDQPAFDYKAALAKGIHEHKAAE